MTLVCSTPKQAIETWIGKTSVCLRDVLNEDTTKKDLTNFLAGELTKFVDILSTAGQMGPEKIYRIAQEFLKCKDVRHLTLEELKFFLSQAFKMEYGKVYHGFGLDVLMVWFGEYFDIRQREIMEYREREHNETTPKVTRIKTPEMVLAGGDMSNAAPIIKKIINND